MGKGEALRQKASCEADRAERALATAHRLGRERRRLRALSVDAWTRAVRARGAAEEQQEIRQQQSLIQWVPYNCSFAD